MKRTLLITILLFVFNIVVGQDVENENEIYTFNYEDGHYYFDAKVNNIPVKNIFLESAIPGLLIGNEMFEKTFGRFGLENMDKQTGKKIMLHKNIYEIGYIFPMSVNINDGVFEGNIFVLKDHDMLAIPIQKFSHHDKTKPYLEIDLGNKTMKFLNETEWDNKEEYEQFELEQINGFPIITTDITVTSNGKTGNMKDSKFILDFGNGSLAFLMKGNKAVDEMLSESGLELFEGRNKNGEVVSEAIMADNSVICGREFNNLPIGLTDKMKAFQVFSGLLGVKFFTSPVVFDFVNGKFYVRK